MLIDDNKKAIVNYGILDSIFKILSSTPNCNNDLKYWTLLILHQLSLTGIYSFTLFILYNYLLITILL